MGKETLKIILQCLAAAIAALLGALGGVNL